MASRSREYDEEGYEYKRVSKASRTGTSYYNCTKETCQAKLIVYSNGERKKRQQRTHLPPVEKPALEAIIEQMRMQAATGNMSIPSLYRDASLEASRKGIDHLFPTFDSVKSTLYRFRSSKYPHISHNPLEVSFPGAFSLTLSNQNFLLMDKRYHIGSTEKRIIVFGTLQNLEFLSSSSFWLMDGTFSRVPEGWRQLFTIHSQVGVRSRPLIFALLMSKCRRTYSELLHGLKCIAHDQGWHLAPEIVMKDFETGSQAALRLEFPNTTIKGCYFHFCSCVLKFIQQNGYVVLYKEVTGVTEFFRECMAIPFLPPAKISYFIDSFIERFFFCGIQGMPYNSAIDMISKTENYLSQTWVPMAEQLSVYHMETRTNNQVEGWHSALSRSLRAHPNPFDLVSCLQKEQGSTEALFRDSELGASSVPKKKLKYALLDERIANITREHDNHVIDDATYVTRLSKLVHQF